jgi:aminoglycoside phosphotransferase (APT) family kinase protein
VLFHASGEVSAVLDWEIATLGAPLADLAYAINAWVGPSDDPMGIANPATALPGFNSREEVLRNYVAVCRADISDLDFYRAFNLWKRACILQGVHARYATGQKSSDGVDLDVLRCRIDDSIAAAVRLADASPGLVGR